jgi:hypothetical protein
MVPALTVWLLEVLAVKVACAPTPTRLKPATLNAPAVAIFLNCMTFIETP